MEEQLERREDKKRMKIGGTYLGNIIIVISIRTCGDAVISHVVPSIGIVLGVKESICISPV